MAASAPYARALTRAVSAVATVLEHRAPADHRDGRTIKRAAVAASSRRDRGLAGALHLERHQGGGAARRAAARRRARRSSATSSAARRVGYYSVPRARDRGRSGPASPTAPEFDDAKEVADALVEAFLRRHDRGRRGRDPHRLQPVRRMVTQDARGHPAAAARGRRGRRRRPDDGRGPAAVRVRARRRGTCSTRCCRGYIESRIFNACCRPPRPSTPPASGR